MPERNDLMKLRSSKSALSAGIAMVMCLMPVMPVVVDAGPTYEQQQSTTKRTETLTASYDEYSTDAVATGYANKKENENIGKAIAIADPYTFVYSSADENSEAVGRLYNGNAAEVVELADGWTKITSGNVSGYVKSEVLCFGEEADELALEQDANGVNYGTQNGYTNEEAEAKEAAEKAAAEEAARKAEEARKAAEAAKAAQEKAAAEAAAKAAQASKQKAATTTTGTAVAAGSDDVLLLATIIDWESGYECYEGKLAVANVVLNRVRSSKYPNSISAVIYAKGQFSGVSDGNGNPSAKFSQRLAAGPRSQDCIRAAQEALNGVNNIGSYTSFRATRIANYSAYSSYTVIGGHCFY